METEPLRGGAAPERGARVSWLTVGVVLLALGVALRVANAVTYLPLFGFDAVHNWDYVSRLMLSWSLPAADASWSTARPPLFYYLAAAVARLFDSGSLHPSLLAIRLASSACGVGAALLAANLAWRSGASRRRAAIALGLVLFLPAHLVMSAMLNEEILVASLTAAAIYLASRNPEAPLRIAAAIGVVSGLALLTKLTGALVTVAAAVSFAVNGIRRGRARAGIVSAAVVVSLAVAIGGWFYLRSILQYGSAQPVGMVQHHLMFAMPPGERHVSDYLRFPIATFTDPRATNPDLLRSVWGTTYASLWFDAHRHFVPRLAAKAPLVGGLILLLALLPTTACAIGIGRGLRRARQEASGPDLPLLLLIASTLAGFVLFSLRNPWFATVKGTYLLGLALPCAYYASEVLAEWTSSRPGRRGRAFLCTSVLVSLVVLTTLAFSFETPLWSWGPPPSRPGLNWFHPSP